MLPPHTKLLRPAFTLKHPQHFVVEGALGALSRFDRNLVTNSLFFPAVVSPRAFKKALIVATVSLATTSSGGIVVVSTTGVYVAVERRFFSTLTLYLWPRVLRQTHNKDLMFFSPPFLVL